MTRNAGEIKRHPEVETLLVTGDVPTEVMKKVLDWPAEGMNRGPSLIISYLYLSYLDFDDGLRLCRTSDT